MAPDINAKNTDIELSDIKFDPSTVSPNKKRMIISKSSFTTEVVS